MDDFTTAVSELIQGDKIWLAEGISSKIIKIEYLGEDLYDLYLEDGSVERNIPGDLMFNLVELHEGIDY